MDRHLLADGEEGARGRRPVPCAAVCGTLGPCVFAVALVLTMVPSYIVCLCGCCLMRCLPPRLREKHTAGFNRIVIGVTVSGWRLALLACWWIRRRALDLRGPVGKSGRPPVIVANHTSFLDIIVMTTSLPLSTAVNVKMLVSNHLFRMPLLGRIVECMGHQAVPFKRSEGGAFELDRELMAERMSEMGDHLRRGGCSAWFPEGTINSNPRELTTFRAGGFRLAVDTDAEIWCVANFGNAECWPKHASVGGRPSRIAIKMVRLCESTHAFLQAADLGEGRETIHLARCAQELIQSELDKFAREGS